MVVTQEYDSGVKRLKAAATAGLALFILAATFASAQINGVPASVTSLNFGGNLSPAPGVRASVTSLGPNGFAPHGQFFNQPACCINPLFPISSRPFPAHRHHHRDFFPVAAVPVYVPYQPGYLQDEAEQDDQAQVTPDEYRGGPTVFDRRGPGAERFTQYSERRHGPETSAETEPPEASAATPVTDQPQTVLVFKDGHQIEVQNYAVIGNTLYDLSPGQQHRIQLADLNLEATAKQNDDRGIDFRLPPKGE